MIRIIIANGIEPGHLLNSNVPLGNDNKIIKKKILFSNES